MFQAETEDMLPRMAPKPSPDVISGSGESVIRPQVPEVSILFGQQDASYQQQLFMHNTHQQGKDFPQQTYAAWKKQMLPKVTFPATTSIANTRLTGGNDMMGYNCTTTNMNSIQLSANPTMKLAPSTNVFGGRDTSDQVPNPLTFRRSLELCNNNNAYQPIQHVPMLPLQAPLHNSQPSSSSRSEILTICAGTQTDDLKNSQSGPFFNLATKNDVESIWKMLEELRNEQQRMIKMLETFSLSQNLQTTKKISYCDVGVQVDFNETTEPVYLNGDIGVYENHQPMLKNKFVENLKPTNNMFQSPKGKPVAQSTTYRPNSPQYQNLKPNLQEMGTSPVYNETKDVVAMIPKSASDTSLAMSELALKYLPNEKLSELLKELNMDYPKVNVTDETTTPNITNSGKFEKGPSDISHASYKYLKKYRLLPEDPNDHVKDNAGEGAIQNDIENHTPQYSSPQYMQNTPIHQRQTPVNKCSPYAAGCLPLSPLARASPPPIQSAAPPHIVNLDNIKQKPKFL